MIGRIVIFACGLIAGCLIFWGGVQYGREETELDKFDVRPPHCIYPHRDFGWDSPEMRIWISEYCPHACFNTWYEELNINKW